MHANPTAQRLLENRARFGVPLGTIAPQLTNLVAFNRLDGEASFVADVGGVGVHATLRRAGSSLLIYLDSTAEDIGDAAPGDRHDGPRDPRPGRGALRDRRVDQPRAATR